MKFSLMLIAAAASAFAAPVPAPPAIEARSPQLGGPPAGGFAGPGGHSRDHQETHHEPITPIDINQDKSTQVIAPVIERDIGPVDIHQWDDSTKINTISSKRDIAPVDINQFDDSAKINTIWSKRDIAPVNVKQVDCSEKINSIAS